MKKMHKKGDALELINAETVKLVLSIMLFTMLLVFAFKVFDIFFSRGRPYLNIDKDLERVASEFKDLSAGDSYTIPILAAANEDSLIFVSKDRAADLGINCVDKFNYCVCLKKLNKCKGFDLAKGISISLADSKAEIPLDPKKGISINFKDKIIAVS